LRRQRKNNINGSSGRNAKQFLSSLKNVPKINTLSERVLVHLTEAKMPMIEKLVSKEKKY